MLNWTTPKVIIRMLWACYSESKALRLHSGWFLINGHFHVQLIVLSRHYLQLYSQTKCICFIARRSSCTVSRECCCVNASLLAGESAEKSTWVSTGRNRPKSRKESNYRNRPKYRNTEFGGNSESKRVVGYEEPNRGQLTEFGESRIRTQSNRHTYIYIHMSSTCCWF